MNWFQSFAIRLASRIAPPLGRVLRNAGGTVDRLERSNELLRELVAQRRDNMELEIADYKEAIALAGGGWLPREGNGKYDLVHRESDTTAVKKCKETIADLQLALEDRGWWREMNQSQWEFSRWGIQRIILLCRLYRIKNPLIQRGILVSAYYVFGRGFEVSSKDETAQQVLSDFFNDPRNVSEIGQRALIEKEAAKYTDGNIFWAFFTDPGDGQIIIRTIDALEIEEIITDPNDLNQPRFYHRRWTEQVFDERSGVSTYAPRDEWYVAMGYDAPAGTEINGKRLVEANGERVPIYHVRAGALMKWKFGCPRAYAAIDWARSYKRRLENYATITEALARFSWNVETEGGQPAIAAFKQTLASTLGNVDGLSVEQNPPAVTGAAFITGPGNKLTPIKTTGMTPNPEEGRRLALMVYCVFGLPETFFSDVSVGTLATATSLDRPTELKFLKEQEDWTEDLQRMAYYVLDRSRTAPKGRLRESLVSRGVDPGNVTIRMAQVGLDPKGARLFEKAKPPAQGDSAQTITVAVKFPSIIQGDELNRISAIVDAMTLNGFECTGIDLRTGIGLLLTELGVEDVEDVLNEMFPEGSYEPDRTEELAAVKDLKINPPDPTAPKLPGEKDPKARRSSTTAREVRTAKAVNALLQAAKALKT